MSAVEHASDDLRLGIGLWLAAAASLLRPLRREILHFAGIYIQDDLPAPRIGVANHNLRSIALVDLLTGQIRNDNCPSSQIDLLFWNIGAL